MVTVDVTGAPIYVSSFSVGTLETTLVQAEDVIPTAEETPTVEEPEAESGSVFTEIISSFINAILELVKFFISLF